MSGHPCPAYHCKRTAPDELFACRGHNAELTKSMRRKVNRAWRAEDPTPEESAILRRALAFIGRRLLESEPSASAEAWIRRATR